MTLALEALAAVFQHPDSLFLIVSDDKDFEPLVLKLQSRGAVVAVATKRGAVLLMELVMLFVAPWLRLFPGKQQLAVPSTHS